MSSMIVYCDTVIFESLIFNWPAPDVHNSTALATHIGVGTGGAQGACAPLPIFLVYCKMVSQSTDLD